MVPDLVGEARGGGYGGRVRVKKRRVVFEKDECLLWKTADDVGYRCIVLRSLVGLVMCMY